MVIPRILLGGLVVVEKGGGKGGGGEISGGHIWAMTPISCLTHSWGRINPVYHAPSSLVELRLASSPLFFPAMMSGLLVTGILAGNG